MVCNIKIALYVDREKLVEKIIAKSDSGCVYASKQLIHYTKKLP